VTIVKFNGTRIPRPRLPLLLAALVASGGLLFNSAVRADISCTGTLGGVILYADGTVMISSSWRGDWTSLCNSQNGWAGIDTSTCLAWYGAAVKAAASHIVVATYYSGNTYSCTNLPTYASSISPIYFMTTS
jgi:hypothetical protein